MVLEGVLLDHLTATGAGVVFIDRTAGSLYPTSYQGGAIRTIDSDGGNDTVNYESAEDKLILSLAVFEDEVFFLEETFMGALQEGDVALYRMPLSGDTPELVGSLERGAAPTTELIAVEADFAYVNFGEDGLLRVALSDGTVSQITTEHILHNAVLVGDDIYYTASPEIAQSHLSVIAKDETNATGTILLEDECQDALIAETGLFCEDRFGTLVTVQRYELDGTGPEDLAGFDEGLGGQVVATDADNVYYVASDLPSLDGHPLWQIPLDGGAPVAVACARHELSISDTDGPYPTNRGLMLEQVVLNEGEVIWLEIAVEDEPPNLFRAAL